MSASATRFETTLHHEQGDLRDDEEAEGASGGCGQGRAYEAEAEEEDLARKVTGTPTSPRTVAARREQHGHDRGVGSGLAPEDGAVAKQWSIVAPMTVKLHRCPTTWKVGPCWRVQKALDEQGIDYEVVKGPVRPAKRAGLQRLSGQKLYPVIEFENGLDLS
jgi:hypothetical protein